MNFLGGNKVKGYEVLYFEDAEIEKYKVLMNPSAQQATSVSFISRIITDLSFNLMIGNIPYLEDSLSSSVLTSLTHPAELTSSLLAMGSHTN